MTNSEPRAAIEALYVSRVRLAEQLDDLERDHRRQADALLRQVAEIADGVQRLIAAADPPGAALLGPILLQLEEFLGSQGLTTVRPSVGDPVDGDCEVMATVAKTGLLPGTITRILRPGYRLGERVIRRAGVETVKE